MVYLFLTTISAAPAHSSSTARPPDPDLRSRSPSLASSHAISAAPARPQLVHRPSTGSWPSISLLHLYSLLPCYFCTSSPSTARPPPVHRILTFDLAPPSLYSLLPCYFCSSRTSTARPPPVHRILTFNLAPPSLASSHAISAPPARPQPSLLPCYFCSSRPLPVHRILTFDLAPPSLASSHAISAAPARPQLVHRPSTGSWHSISLLP